MFNFKRAALAFITLLALVGLIAGVGTIIASVITTSLTGFIVGVALLIVSLSIVAGLDQ